MTYATLAQTFIAPISILQVGRALHAEMHSSSEEDSPSYYNTLDMTADTWTTQRLDTIVYSPQNWSNLGPASASCRTFPCSAKTTRSL
jgi:hypothetical protein